MEQNHRGATTPVLRKSSHGAKRAVLIETIHGLGLLAKSTHEVPSQDIPATNPATASPKWRNQGRKPRAAPNHVACVQNPKESFTSGEKWGIAEFPVSTKANGNLSQTT